MTWTNPVTGLVQRFGNENAVDPKAGKQYQGMQRLVVKLTDAGVLSSEAADPTAAAMAAFKDEMTPFIPANSYVTRAYFVVTTAFVGASGTLDIGLIEDDGTTIDINFFLDGEGVANLGAAAVVVCDGAGVGGVVKTGSTDAYVSFSEHATNAFSAGAGYVVIEYFSAEDIVS